MAKGIAPLIGILLLIGTAVILISYGQMAIGSTSTNSSSLGNYATAYNNSENTIIVAFSWTQYIVWLLVLLAVVVVLVYLTKYTT